MLGDPREHSRPDFNVFVKREHDIRPADSFEDTMGAPSPIGSTFNAPTDPQQSPPDDFPGLGCRLLAHGTTAKTLLIWGTASP